MHLRQQHWPCFEEIKNSCPDSKDALSKSLAEPWIIRKQNKLCESTLPFVLPGLISEIFIQPRALSKTNQFDSRFGNLVIQDSAFLKKNLGCRLFSALKKTFGNAGLSLMEKDSRGEDRQRSVKSRKFSLLPHGMPGEDWACSQGSFTTTDGNDGVSQQLLPSHSVTQCTLPSESQSRLDTLSAWHGACLWSCSLSIASGWIMELLYNCWHVHHWTATRVGKPGFVKGEITQECSSQWSFPLHR